MSRCTETKPVNAVRRLSSTLGVCQRPVARRTAHLVVPSFQSNSSLPRRLTCNLVTPAVFVRLTALSRLSLIALVSLFAHPPPIAVSAISSEF